MSIAGPPQMLCRLMTADGILTATMSIDLCCFTPEGDRDTHAAALLF